ncbi:Major Facilitator Superfamily protein [Ceratocystis platani]|uniref:Major Facilitator Superfamily protein n=1 Tax=Ceratocystis fimbriata f. sp. platani TaxID=88771 RepID=A0A0F8B6G1_CERFI|nr:Major Facilitator Superfamily protein [Ceratocystis platani]
MNLFFSGWLIKRLGPRATLIFQTTVPALRILLQITGVIIKGRLGMTIIQTTQAVTIFGGPAGYVLVINVIIGEVVEASRRTATFGRLQGCIMLGMSVGFIVGGQIGNIFGVQMPFRVAFVSFLISSLYSRISLPYIAPGIKHWGVAILCAGIFAGVVATGYAPLLIQMYATAVFDFSQGDNGLLMSEFSFVRSLFLIFVFPRIISYGRKRYAPRREATVAALRRDPRDTGLSGSTTPCGDSQNPLGYGAVMGGSEVTATEADTATETDRLVIPTHPEEVELAAPNAVQVDAGIVVSEEADDDGKGKTEALVDLSFDLVFLRWSLVVDGAMTAMAAFATQKWHIYLAAFFIPLGSGSAPAAKGVISDMCTPSQRADALNAVTLVENMANLTTQGLFGYVFAMLAARGVAHMTFFCNAAIAVVAMVVLLFSRFPPVDCVLVDGDEEPEAESVGREN